MQRKGFSLAEVMIYTALVGIAGVFLNQTLLNVLKLQNSQDASTEVNQQIDFVLKNVQEQVRDSSEIEIDANTATTTLKLRMADPALDPTTIYTSGTAVYLKKGTATPLALTNDKVTADQLQFTKVTAYPGHDSVQVNISLSYNTTSTQSAFTKTITSAVARVSAATFDADIVPGTDNTYSVGQTSARWQNLLLSGGAGIGVTSLANSLDVNGNGAFGTYAGSNAAPTGGLIVSGNVGIGTASPSAPLDVHVSRTSGANASAIYLSDAVTGAQTSLFGTRIVGSSNSGNALSAIGFEAFGGTNNDTGISFYTESTAGGLTRQMIIDSTGKVGIGTASPGGKLDVFTATNDDLVYGNNPRLYLKAPTGINGLRINADATPLEIDNLTANGPYFSIGGNINGTFAPADATASITKQSSPTLWFNGKYWNGSASVTGFQGSIYAKVTNTTAPRGGLSLGIGGSDTLFIQDNGNVGIGTTTPNSALDVNGTVYSETGGFKFPDGTTQTTAASGGGGSSMAESGTGVNFFASPVSTGRNCGTVYTNNTSKPIFVAATAWSLSNGNVSTGFDVVLGTPSAPTTPSYIVQYSAGVSAGGGAPAVSAFSIVPPGYAYEINIISGYGACPNTWTEYQ